MKIKTNYLKNKKLWSAYTTYRGIDMCELSKYEADAIIKLMNRIK